MSLLFALTGYNVFKDSDLLSTKFQATAACDGGSGSSIVFAARKLLASGCNNDPSDPFTLKTKCGQNQAHEAVELAFRDRSSFTLAFRVLCEDSQCGSESYVVLRAREIVCCVGCSLKRTCAFNKSKMACLLLIYCFSNPRVNPD